MAKGTVKDWTKNAAQSVKYTAVELGSETAPFLTSTISSAADAVKDMVDWIKRNTPEKTSNSNKESFVKRAVNKGKDSFKVAMDDLKSGHLNFDGINSKFSNSMGDMFSDYGEEPNFDFDFDDDNGDLFGDSGDSDGGSSSFEGLTSDIYASGLEISTKANIDALAESSNLISQSTLNAASASTKQLVATNFANTARLSSQLADVILNTKATNDNITSLVEFNNNTISPFIGQAQQYMENMEQNLNDIKAILETRLTNPEVQSDNYRRKDLIRGGIDVKEYFKKITNSSMVQVGLAQFAPVITMLQSMGVPLPKFISDNPMISMMGGPINPLKSIAKFTLPSVFGEKSKLRDFDNIFEYFALNIADKLAKSNIFGDFGQRLFDSAYVDKSGYNKNAVVWTGKDSKVLQDVIPSYLSHIEVNTEKTVTSINNVVEILKRTLMGQHGMVHLYDEWTGKALRDEKTGMTYASKHKIDEIRMKYAQAPRDENGQRHINVLQYKPKKQAQYKRTSTIQSSRKDRYADIRIWNSDIGDYTTKKKIRKDFEYAMSGTYRPFTEFFELCEELFDFDNDPTTKDDIAVLVSKWANTLNDVDPSAIVEEIINMHKWNTKSGEEITERERMKMRALLVSAKKRFITERKQIIDSINNGESIFRVLSNAEVDNYRKDMSFIGKDDFTRKMAYSSGDKATIEAYEKQKKLDELRRKQGDVPFNNVLSDEEFEQKYGKYDENAEFTDRALWSIRDAFNRIKRFSNDRVISIRNNGLNTGIGNMEDKIFNRLVAMFTNMQNFMMTDSSQNAYSGQDVSDILSNILHTGAKDISKMAGQQAATGAHRIPEEGWWLLHPDERVLTAEEADEYDELMRMLRNGEISPTMGLSMEPKTSEAIRKKLNKWNSKMANRGFEKMSAADSVAMYSHFDEEPKKKQSRYSIKRRNPTNEDEKKNLGKYTNDEVEKAESKEEAAFRMQQETADNVRSIAAMTAADNERNAKKDKKENSADANKAAKGLFGKLSDALFGKKDDNGFFTDGPFASIANSLVDIKRKFAYTFFGKGYTDKDGNVIEGKDVGGGLRDKLNEYKESAHETLFGRKPTSEVNASNASAESKTKETPKTKGASQVDPIEEATMDVADKISNAGNATVEAAFGTDDIDTLSEKAKQLAVKDRKTAFAEYAKKLGKGALIGGIGTFALKSSLGTIPSLLFPGGPVAGAILGIGGAMLSQTETFKKVVFGDLDENGERTGGLISKSMNERFKKVVPFIVGGAGLGALKKFFLPSVSLIPGPGGALMNMFFGNGPIAGALLGLGGGLLASSEKFKEAIFGEEDEDGELYGGILSRPTEAIRKFYKKNSGSIKGAGIGALAGVLNNRLIASTAGTGGLLYKVFGAGGPIGAAILGSAIGIASGSQRFQEMLFGKDTGEVDANGKPIRDKSGLISRFTNVFEINVIRPLAEWGEYARDSFVNWLKHDLGDHVKSIFKPLQDALQEAGENVADVFGNLGGTLAKMLGLALHPIKKLLPEALKLGVKITTGALTGAGKMIGGTITAPLKIFDFMKNASPFGNAGGKKFKGENKAFQESEYGGSGIANFMDFMFNREEWNARRYAFGKDKLGLKDSDGFFYYNRKENAKIDKKDVTDEYKRRKGITAKMQKWAAKDGYNGSIILDDKTLENRKEWLAKRGVDTKGWNSQDMVDFMYSNDEKRKAKKIADEDAKLQREANKAEISTSEEVRTIKDVLTDVKNPLFNRDDKVTKSESDEVERMKESDGDFKATDMPSEESKNVFTALNAIEHNKSIKSDKEKAKAAEDAKKAESQALAGKAITDETGENITNAAVDAVAEEESKSGGILSKITEFVGKGLAIGAIGLLATKVNWSGLFDVIKGAVSNVIDGFKESNKDSRTWIDEETGEEVTATSALSASNVLPRLGKSAWQFATGNNLAAFLNIANGGKLSKKAGGLIGWASARSGARLNEAAWKGFSALNKKIHKASSVAKAALSYGDDVLSEASVLEKLFAKIYKCIDKMKSSKALAAIGGSWLGKVADAIGGAIKKVFSKFKNVLGKATGKLSDAFSKGLAKVGIKSVDDFVPILNIVTGAADAITGAVDAANIFHVDSDNLNIRMRFIAAAIGWMKGTMVGSLLDIICEVLKDAVDFDFWNFIAVSAYKVIADKDDEDKLRESIDQLEAECNRYNQEHGTNLSVTAYNDNIKNRTVFTKFLGLFGVETEGQKAAKGEKTSSSNSGPDSTKTYVQYYNLADASSTDTEGYGNGMPSVGYGVDHYVQNDPRWGRRKYGRRKSGGSTSMATGGCGPTALANAASQLGVNVNPAQVARLAQSNGYTSDGGTNARMFTDGVKKLGLKSTNIGRGGVRSALKHGKKVILSGKGSDGVYTNVGHIISARGLDSRGNAIVDDPMRRRSRHIPLSKLTANSTHAWSIGYGPDLTVGEAATKYGNPVEYQAPNSLVDEGINTLYYAYQQTYSDTNNPDRDWANKTIYGGEVLDEKLGNLGNDTIGLSGCILTAISSLVSNFLHRDFDPLTFAKLYGKEYWNPNGIIKRNSQGSADAIIDALNKEYGIPGGSVPFAEYLTSYHGAHKVKKSASGEPYTEEFKPSKTNISGKLSKLKGATYRVLENDAASPFSVNSPTHSGLFYGYPVVMHGSGYPFTEKKNSQHAIVLRGVYQKNGELYTTIFDPGKSGRNNTGIPLNDILNDTVLANTTRFITVNGMGDLNIPTSWDQYAAAFDKDMGTTHDDLTTNAYDNTTTPKSSSASDSSNSSNAEKPSGLLDAISSALSGISKIAGNIFSALGTKDFTYTSIYDENKTSSLIGSNGFNESVSPIAALLDEAKKANTSSGSGGSGSSSTYTNYRSEDAISPSVYSKLKSQFESAEFGSFNDPLIRTGIGSTYKSIPELSSSKLPTSVIDAMKTNIIPMIAYNEARGEINHFITDTNGKVAFGIGGFNGSNAAEVLRRIAAVIQDQVQHVDDSGNMINAKGYFKFTRNDPTEWSTRAEKLLSYADKANIEKGLNQTDYNEIEKILKNIPDLTKKVEVAVLDDLIHYYMKEPLKKYDDGTLLDPRSVMQLAEFGGYGPDHLNRLDLWNTIKAYTTTPELNVANVRDAMVKYYAANTSYFTPGHKDRIGRTASSLLTKSFGFAPPEIMPGAEYGINYTNYEYALGDYLKKLDDLAEKEKYSISQKAVLEDVVRKQLKEQIDNGEKVDLSNLGLGPGNNYSSADIYTDQDDIQRYNANNPLPVKMNTRPIESRIDTIIRILQQMVTAYTAQQSVSEGYGRAGNPIGNSQRVRNAGITTPAKVPLYEKDINQNYTDPLRRVFQTIAASPR